MQLQQRLAEQSSLVTGQQAPQSPETSSLRWRVCQSGRFLFSLITRFIAISWTAETVENFVLPLSVSKTG